MVGLGPVGPGPGAYMLPPTVGYPRHDPTRTRWPAYTLGARGDGAALRRSGPGPVYKIDRVTREGEITSPAWSFGFRLKGRTAADRTPGPGAHAPERCPRPGPSTPAYSMGARLDRTQKRGGPAANAYDVKRPAPTPAYSLGARLEQRHLKVVSPGPATYFQRDQDVYKYRPPVYSLGARLAGNWKSQRTPGPAAYALCMYNNKKSSLAYSFGVRHSPWAPPLVTAEDNMDCL